MPCYQTSVATGQTNNPIRPWCLTTGKTATDGYRFGGTRHAAPLIVTHRDVHGH